MNKFFRAFRGSSSCRYHSRKNLFQVKVICISFFWVPTFKAVEKPPQTFHKTQNKKKIHIKSTFNVSRKEVNRHKNKTWPVVSGRGKTRWERTKKINDENGWDIDVVRTINIWWKAFVMFQALLILLFSSSAFFSCDFSICCNDKNLFLHFARCQFISIANQRWCDDSEWQKSISTLSPHRWNVEIAFRNRGKKLKNCSHCVEQIEIFVNFILTKACLSWHVGICYDREETEF